jgi:hypothetical protein
MKEQFSTFSVWIHQDMIYSGRVERARSPNYPVHNIALMKQEFREVGTILTGYSSY